MVTPELDPGITHTDSSFPPLNSSIHGSDSSAKTPVHSSGTQNPKPIWSGVANRSRIVIPNSSKGLSYRPPLMVDGDMVARIGDSVLAPLISECKELVVGAFVGRRKPFKMVKNSIEKAWNIRGSLEMTVHGDKAYFLKFSLEEDRVTALEFGPVFVDHSPFFVKEWEPFAEQQLESIQSVPVWMTIRKVPVHLFNPEGLSYISSVVGKPVLLDGPTAAKTRMSYARVCVEVTPQTELKRDITIVFDNGHKCSVIADYAWKPDQCAACSTFSHNVASCPKKTMEQAPPVMKSVYMRKTKKNTNVGKAITVVVDSQMKGDETDWQPVSHKRKASPNNGVKRNVGAGEQDGGISEFPPGFEPVKEMSTMQVPSLSPIIQNSFAVLEESSSGDKIAEEKVVATSKENEAASSTSTFPSIPPGFEGCNRFHGLEDEEEVATSKLEVEDLEITHKPSSPDSILVSNRKVSLKSKATGLFPNGTLSSKKKHSTKSLDSSKISTNKLVDHGSLYGLSFPSSTRKCREMCNDVVKNHKHLSLEEIDESP